jgi:hypothetical protein
MIVSENQKMLSRVLNQYYFDYFIGSSSSQMDQHQNGGLGAPVVALIVDSRRLQATTRFLKLRAIDMKVQINNIISSREDSDEDCNL